MPFAHDVIHHQVLAAKTLPLSLKLSQVIKAVKFIKPSNLGSIIFKNLYNKMDAASMYYFIHFKACVWLTWRNETIFPPKKIMCNSRLLLRWEAGWDGRFIRQVCTLKWAECFWVRTQVKSTTCMKKLSHSRWNSIYGFKILFKCW